MKLRKLRILFVEDSEDDARLTLDLLERNGFDIESIRVETAADFEAALADSWDLILADYLLPGFNALEALRIYNQLALDIPFIIVSGSIGEDVAVEAMRHGAHDYLLKGRLARLPVAIERELREAENRREKRIAEDQRRRAEEELRVKNDELSWRAEQLYRSNKDLERFAYIAAHDLQEPLRNVKLFSQSLARTPAGNANVGNAVGYITEGVDRMQRLIDGLLAYSRVTHNPDHSMADAEMDQVLATAVAALSEQIAESKALITHDHLPSVYADPIQIGQVFQNLIGNAIKYQRPNSQPRIHVSSRVGSGELTFCVQDNGIGIAPEHHDHIFLIFRRLHRNEYPGTGVGLALAKRIVENHGGRIWVESDVGKGATFCFSLPVVAADHYFRMPRSADSTSEASTA